MKIFATIGIWGGADRVYATTKFVMYTMAGSALMLVAIAALPALTGASTYHLFDVLQRPALDRSWQLALFAAFAIAFAVKVPLVPLHTWLPDAHVEAPTAGSVILAGVLLKMGTYGLLRFCLPLFPDAAVRLAPFVATLAIIGIIYGALVSMVQPDLKKLIAYSSVSHLGFVVLGIFASAMNKNCQLLQSMLLQIHCGLLNTVLNGLRRMGLKIYRRSLHFFA